MFVGVLARDTVQNAARVEIAHRVEDAGPQLHVLVLEQDAIPDGIVQIPHDALDRLCLDGAGCRRALELHEIRRQHDDPRAAVRFRREADIKRLALGDGAKELVVQLVSRVSRRRFEPGLECRPDLDECGARSGPVGRRTDPQLKTYGFGGGIVDLEEKAVGPLAAGRAPMEETRVPFEQPLRGFPEPLVAGDAAQQLAHAIDSGNEATNPLFPSRDFPDRFQPEIASTAELRPLLEYKLGGGLPVHGGVLVNSVFESATTSIRSRLIQRTGRVTCRRGALDAVLPPEQKRFARDALLPCREMPDCGWRAGVLPAIVSEELKHARAPGAVRRTRHPVASS